MPYDAYGQLIRENNDILNKTILYTYDNIGNITAAQTYNYTLNDVSGAPTEEDTYTYSASYPDRLTIFNGKGITYDALGCVKTYDGWTYTWNKGKLSAMRKGPANSAAIAPSEAYTFAYNALGQRIEKKYTFSANASQTIDYLASCTSTYEYDLSGRLIREKRVSKYSDGVTITRVFSYLYEGSEIVGLIYNNGSTAVPYYYDKNPSGDVVAILDSTGTAVVKYKYDAFGRCSWLESTNNDLAQSNPIRYRSYCYDEDTGLYYLNARYYNPQWRRFISPDSTEYLDSETPNGLNLYAYCGNDPVNYADPSGRSVALVLLGAFAVGAITGASISIATQLVENDFNINGINPWLVFSDAMFGGVSGLLAASGIGALGSAYLGATLSAIQLAVNSAITGEEITMVDFLVTTAFGFIGGFIPKAGINAKQVSGKFDIFKMHIKNAVGSRRFNMYSQKLSKLTLEVALCGVNYIVSTVVASIAMEHISNNMERYYYGY